MMRNDLDLARVASKRSPRQAISTSVVQICRNLHAPRQVQTPLDLSYKGRFLSYAFVEVQDRAASKAIYDSSAARGVLVLLALWNLAIGL